MCGDTDGIELSYARLLDFSHVCLKGWEYIHRFQVANSLICITSKSLCCLGTDCNL
jgi:hypothetical protein